MRHVIVENKMTYDEGDINGKWITDNNGQCHNKTYRIIGNFAVVKFSRICPKTYESCSRFFFKFCGYEYPRKYKSHFENLATYISKTFKYRKTYSYYDHSFYEHICEKPGLFFRINVTRIHS